jgi:hypothetical protein
VQRIGTDPYVELHNSNIVYEVSEVSMTVAMRFTISLLYIIIMGKSCLSPNFPLRQEASNDCLPTQWLRSHGCGLLNTLQMALMAGSIRATLHYQFTFCCLSL